MALSDDDYNAAQTHLREKWKAATCPMCKTEPGWALSGYVSVPVTGEEGVLPWGAGGIPCVAAICQNCGNTVLVALRVIRGKPQTDG